MDEKGGIRAGKGGEEGKEKKERDPLEFIEISIFYFYLYLKNLI